MTYKIHMTFMGIIVVGILLYSNTFYAAFHYDDYSNIVNNANIHWDEISLKNFKKLFRWFLDRDVSYLTFSLNYYWGGLNVVGYHIFNLTIHVASGILLYLFLFETINLPVNKGKYGEKAEAIAGISSLLWLANAVQTQSVTYIVQRMTSMASLFYVVAFLFFIKGRVSTGIKRLIYWFLTVASFIISLGCKELILTLPILILVYDICFFQKRSLKQIFSDKTTYLWLSVIIILISLLIYFRGFINILPTIGFAFKERIYTESRVIMHYISLLAWPIPGKMSLMYSFPLSRTLFVPYTTFLSLLTLLAAFILAVFNIKRQPLLSFCVLWFIITISAESFVVGPFLVFEHRLYLPSMLFFPLFVIAGSWIWERGKKGGRVLLIVMAALIVSAYSINTYMRNFDWIDNHSIYADSAKKYPRNTDAKMSLGAYYYNNDMTDKAIIQFEKVRDLNPRDSTARWYLGKSYYRSGFYSEAIEELNKAINLGEMDYDVYGTIGDAYSLTGSFVEAEVAYRKAIELAADNTQSEKAKAALESVKQKYNKER